MYMLMCLCGPFVKTEDCNLSQYRLNYSHSNTEQSAILYLVSYGDLKQMCILTAMAIQLNLLTDRFKHFI